MIYYGQELGERATENEGFAGYNNRSTIFDYWSYDPMRRWYNSGRCNMARLNAQEKWLRNVYSKVLNMINDRPALREGAFFDLMYVNLVNPGFDPHHCFCFLRYTAEEKLLICVNFGDEEARIEVTIPELAFDMAGLREGVFHTRDLLWNHPVSLSLSRIAPTHIVIPPRDAMIVPLTDTEGEKQ